jgi:mevalonyl-CoA ligase
MTTSLPDSIPPGAVSIVKGSTEQTLRDITLSQLLEQQAQQGSQQQCVVFPVHNYRATYQQLYQSTLAVAKGLISVRVLRGDNIRILAGNCPQDVELFIAAAHVGAALVVPNSTYTPAELESARKHSGLVATSSILILYSHIH